MSELKNTTVLEDGSVSISDNVLRTIANIATDEIVGVDGLSGGIAEDFVEMFGVKSHTKGVRIDAEGDSLVINMSIIVNYGSKIKDIAESVQVSVKQAVETMTGLNVSAVNIAVVGISMKIGESTEKQKED